MTTPNALKVLLLSTAGSLVLLLISCFFWTDFKLDEITDIMFWVGTLVVIVGGSHFFPGNKYQNQSEAAMYSLRFSSGADHRHAIDKKESQLTANSIKGALIASPGLIMIIVAFML